MSDASWHEYAVKTVRILQISIGAMLLGVMLFMVIALSNNLGNPPAFAITPVFLIAGGMVFPLFIVRFISIRLFTASP